MYGKTGGGVVEHLTVDGVPYHLFQVLALADGIAVPVSQRLGYGEARDSRVLVERARRDAHRALAYLEREVLDGRRCVVDVEAFVDIHGAEILFEQPLGACEAVLCHQLDCSRGAESYAAIAFEQARYALDGGAEMDM